MSNINRLTHTHTTTYNAIEFADPYKVCDVCGKQVTGVLCVTKGRWPNLPCEHIGYTDTCPSWGPVDGCQCLEHLGFVPHNPLRSSPE